jgi:hypothetical protein
MIPTAWLRAIAFIGTVAWSLQCSAVDKLVPLTRAHAHNDYEHRRPLLDALDQGFCSVEADIFLVDGELRVAHSRAGIRPGRTLQSLYLDPLRARIEKNGGQVYPGNRQFVLLVDIKEDGARVYGELRRVFEGYASILTRFDDEKITPGAITVYLSGDRPFDLVAADHSRYCALDGRIADLDKNPPVALYPLISESWSDVFRWNGKGKFPETDRAKLLEIVNRTHAQGRQLRFWATPDRPEGWKVLYEAGVDWLNTDRLPEMQQFLAPLLSAKP